MHYIAASCIKRLVYCESLWQPVPRILIKIFKKVMRAENLTKLYFTVIILFRSLSGLLKLARFEIFSTQRLLFLIIILFFFFLSFFSNFSFKIGNLSSISLESYLISNEKMIAAIQKILFSASISRNI